MINIKVKGGTTPGSGSLCTSCKKAMVIRGVGNQQVVRCSAIEREVGFEVAECSYYQNANQPALYEMEEIAWRLVTKMAGRTLGFVNPTTFRKLEGEGEVESDHPAQRPGF